MKLWITTNQKPVIYPRRNGKSWSKCLKWISTHAPTSLPFYSHFRGLTCLPPKLRLFLCFSTWASHTKFGPTYYIFHAKATVISYIHRVMDFRLLFFSIYFPLWARAVNVCVPGRECVQRSVKVPFHSGSEQEKSAHFMRKSEFDSSFYSHLTKWNKNNLLLLPSVVWSAGLHSVFSPNKWTLDNIFIYIFRS